MAAFSTLPMTTPLPGDDPTPRQVVLILMAILTAAVAARIGARLPVGDADYWHNNYRVFYAAAQHLVAGGGFCVETRCSRPPIYVAFLALTIFAGKSYLAVVLPQALIGAGTALCAYLIGRDVFNARTGLIAATLTAFHPYYVMHDTALQDTAMATFALALSVWLLLRARRDNRNRDWALAGAALGAAVLVRVALAPTVAAAIVWILVWGRRGSFGERLRAGAMAALAAAVVISPWLAYTAGATGAPVLSTDVGYELWVGNNPDTFSRFPQASIDRSSQVGRARFSPAERTELKSLRGNALAVSHWYAQRALSFMGAAPEATAQRALRKIGIAFSWRLTPYRTGFGQWAYAAFYIPVALLAVAGMVRARRRPETALVVLLILVFIAVTAVFSAQTSHRVYLDVYMIVFAAAEVALWTPITSRATAPTVSLPATRRSTKVSSGI
jgi:4-amino-4-deoxy-L-arabinose transferase-like glycosyltransferase